MKNYPAKIFIMFLLFIIPLPFFSQESDSSIYMDFRNQKISDIIYSVADVCGKSVIIDETVSGNATFRFEDKDFENRGYKRYPPTDIDCEAVKYFYQKRLDGTVAQKYFITAKKWTKSRKH